MLRKLGFGGKLIGWIRQCLVSTHISVLVWGFYEGIFPQRGLRQGDPLVPFLVTIIVKGLSGMMREIIFKDMFEGFLVGKCER